MTEFTDNVKKAIINREYYTNGMNKLNGTGVKVVNMKINTRDNNVTCDVILYFEGNHERYNGCEYPLDTLMEG